MVRIKSVHVRFVVEAALYYHRVGGKYSIFKPAHTQLAQVSSDPGSWPRNLFVLDEDKISALQEIQVQVNQVVSLLLEQGEMAKVKELLVGVVEESLADPRAGSLEGLSGFVVTLADQCASSPQVLRNLARISSVDYTTGVHSVNVMGMCMAYAVAAGMKSDATQTLGLAALLHDAGKAEIDPEILKANRALTKAEFRKMQMHPLLGYKILRQCNLGGEEIALGALQHHEKLDGSGYPKGLRNPSNLGRIIGLVDCYEALTADERLYRNSMDPFEALNLIGHDVEAGKLDRAIFQSFVKTLN